MTSTPRKHPVGRVVATSPDWHLSGVNVFVARLFRELQHRGWDATIVLTNPGSPSTSLAPLPDDIPVVRFPATANRAIRERQSMLCTLLSEKGPCVYLPNYDFDTAGVIPTLPRTVATVGVLHSDEAIYYQFAEDLGNRVDAMVAVSTLIQEETTKHFPSLSGKISRIPCGVPCRRAFPEKAQRPPLRVIYAGRISQKQKRILDLAEIIRRTHESGEPVRFDIAGDGPERAEFARLVSASIEAGTTRMHGALSPEATGALFDTSHVMILTSEFEGLPVVLLEGMEAGCVPIVTRIRSGIGELVEDGKTGILFDVGDIDAACAAILRLANNESAAISLSASARDRLASSQFTLEHAADSYSALFERILAARLDGTFQHIPGQPFIPRHHRWTRRIAERWARLIGRSNSR